MANQRAATPGDNRRAGPRQTLPEPRELVVIGHADAAGPDAYNMQLSRHRASDVKRHLASKVHGAGKPIRVVGKGETELAAPDDGSKNRRVQVLKR